MSFKTKNYHINFKLILIVLVILILIVASCIVYYNVSMDYKYHHEVISNNNTEAKLIYTTTLSYMDNCNKYNAILEDGYYAGKVSLQAEQNTILYNATPIDLKNSLAFSLGGKNNFYYCILIYNNKIIDVKYSEKQNLLKTFNGNCCGSYPNPNIQSVFIDENCVYTPVKFD